MDFLRLDTKDWEEATFNLKGIQETFYNKGEKYKSSSDNDILINEERKSLIYSNLQAETNRISSVYLSYVKFTASSNMLIQTNTGIENIALYFVKQGDNHLSVNGETGNRLLLPSHSNNIYFMHEDYNEYGLYKKDKVYESISLHLPVDYFERLVNLYPDLFEKVFLKYSRGESFYLKEQYEKTNFKFYNILKQIENSCLMGSCNHAYVDAKVLEILALQFQTESCCDNTLCGTCCKTKEDHDKIREAAYILLSDIHNPPSIKELSLKVGINEKKLKCGFKALYNNTIYGYLFDHKMKLAEQLLLNTQKTINEIATQCGYEYTSHFSTAFKRRFGISPLAWKQKIYGKK